MCGEMAPPTRQSKKKKESKRTRQRRTDRISDIGREENRETETDKHTHRAMQSVWVKQPQKPVTTAIIPPLINYHSKRPAEADREHNVTVTELLMHAAQPVNGDHLTHSTRQMLCYPMKNSWESPDAPDNCVNIWLT